MDATASPTNGAATAGATAGTTPTTITIATSTATGNSNGGFQPALLAIVIPFSAVVFGTLVGAITYVILRRRPRSRKDSDSSSGSPDEEQQAMTRSAPGDVILGSTRVFAGHRAPPPEEGLNELGEAPPPYAAPEGGTRAKRRRRGAPEESAREVREGDDEDGEDGEQGGEGSGVRRAVVVEEQAQAQEATTVPWPERREGGGGTRTGNTAELPPPTYDAVLDANARLSLMTPIYAPAAHA